MLYFSIIIGDIFIVYFLPDTKTKLVVVVDMGLFQ